MIFFIDESGDAGFNFDKGSSRFFALLVVIFPDYEKVTLYDQAITNLKHKLEWQHNREFHFKKNPDKIKHLFISSFIDYEFTYYSLILNKETIIRSGLLNNKKELYLFAIRTTFEELRDHLNKSTIIFDIIDNPRLEQQIRKLLREIAKPTKINSIKFQKSSSNNLLQLADYLASLEIRDFKNYDNKALVKKILMKRKKRIILN